MSALMTLRENEQARLNALRDLSLLDTTPGENFDRLTRLASQLLRAPVSAISLTDGDRQWFKSKVGVDLARIPRADAPCHYAIQEDGVFVVPDILKDPRFATSPLAKAGLRFYAGAPLFTRSGYGLGILCVLDTHPRTLTPEEKRVLQDLAEMVMCQIELQNMIGRVDAGSGLPNQYQFFEDIGSLARQSPGQTFTLLKIELLTPTQASHVLRALGASHMDSIVQAAVSALRPLLGNNARLYQVGQLRCAILLEGSLAQAEAQAEAITSMLSRPILIDAIPVTPHPVTGIYDFSVSETGPRDALRRASNALEDARCAVRPIARYDVQSEQRAARRPLLRAPQRFRRSPDRKGSARAGLSAPHRPRDRQNGRCRSPPALETPHARRHLARRIRAAGRENRPLPKHDGMGRP